jgi:hypothetical protein
MRLGAASIRLDEGFDPARRGFDPEGPGIRRRKAWLRIGSAEDSTAPGVASIPLTGNSMPRGVGSNRLDRGFDDARRGFEPA